MADRSKIIGVRVTPDEREKFEEHLERTNEFDSLSRFFRVLAHRHIESDDEEASIDSEEIIEAVDAAISPVREKLDQVEEHVVAIDSTVSDDDKIDKLARDIYMSLPTVSNESELPAISNGERYENSSDFEVAQAISTPYLWAQYFDEEIADARRACARMTEYFPDVEYVSVDLGAEGGHVPTHDDISIQTETHAPDHTDISPTKSDPSVDETREASDGTMERLESTGIERRYYKTEGD